VIVATTSIIGDLVHNVVRNEAVVEVIMPRGADPHEFSPSVKQIALLYDADLVVSNGAGFEEPMTDVLRSAREEGADVYELASTYDAVGATGDRSSEEGARDPHVWLDPLQTAAAVKALGAELAAIPGATKGWAARAGAYSAEIRSVHRDVDDVLSTIPGGRRKLVVSHDTFGYWAERYGFEVIGAAIPSVSSTTGSSAAQLEELADSMREEGITAIFSDNTVPEALLQTLAGEVERDVEVVTLLTDSLAPRGEEGDTYLEMLEVNAQRMADALG
jgi:zinc/manganese transport system substrate-binding protein